MNKRKTHYLALVASSIDGRISLNKKTLPNWTSQEDWLFLQKTLSQTDAVIVGRNTYQAAINYLQKRNTFVFSHRFATIKCLKNATFVNPATVDLRKFFQQYKTVAILGGGGVYREMLEKNLLDEIFVTLEPLIFGRGAEMFRGGTATTRANLVSIKQLNKKGTVLLHYKISKK